MRYSSIFRSRWMALLWAAGILWTAYDFAAPDDDPPPPAANAVAPDLSTLDAADLRKIERGMAQLHR